MLVSNEYFIDIYVTHWHTAQEKCRVILEVVLEFHGGVDCLN